MICHATWRIQYDPCKMATASVQIHPPRIARFREPIQCSFTVIAPNSKGIGELQDYLVSGNLQCKFPMQGGPRVKLNQENLESTIYYL